MAVWARVVAGSGRWLLLDEDAESDALEVLPLPLALLPVPEEDARDEEEATAAVPLPLVAAEEDDDAAPLRLAPVSTEPEEDRTDEAGADDSCPSLLWLAEREDDEDTALAALLGACDADDAEDGAALWVLLAEDERDSLPAPAEAEEPPPAEEAVTVAPLSPACDGLEDDATRPLPEADAPPTWACTAVDMTTVPRARIATHSSDVALTGA